MVGFTVPVSSSASAYGKTRIEVYREQIEAKRNGLNHVTETLYPDVNPIYMPQVTRIKHEHLARHNAAAVDSTAN